MSFFPTRTGKNQNDQAEIAEGVLFGWGPDDRPDFDRWMLTDHENIGEKSYWVQVVMIGDPGGRWWGVVADEMLEHVIIPILSVVPALGLAMMLTTAISLRPLERTARQAAALAEAVGGRARLTPLSTEKLPREFYEVVTAINAMLGKLEHAFDLQKQFTSDAAHELRTPLAVLLLQLEQLPPGPTVDEIRRGLEKFAALIQEILQFAQAENASNEERQPADLVAIARAVCEDLAISAHERQQIIEFDVSHPTVPILGHPALIETAIRNVVDNALKYSPKATTISVSVNTSSQVVVSDAGPGIRDEHKELVFNRFWRAKQREAWGAGIGLAMVRRITELHEGSVKIEDRPHGGTCVALNFATRPLPERKIAKSSA
jgi:signal transduction histidine kinase